MTRKPDGAEPRSEFIRFRTTPAGREEINRLRGKLTISAYFRQLIAQDSRRADSK